MTHQSVTGLPPFPAARFIKEIGRGKDGARSMTREDAKALYQAMLAGQVSDLELGGILLSMRIKGESIDEIAGFIARPSRCAGAGARRYAGCRTRDDCRDFCCIRYSVVDDDRTGQRAVSCKAASLRCN